MKIEANNYKQLEINCTQLVYSKDFSLEYKLNATSSLKR